MEKILGFVIILTGLVTGNAIGIELILPDTYNEVVPGQNLWFTSSITNGPDSTVTLIYEVHDEFGGLVVIKSETFEDENEIVSFIKIPGSVDVGKYELKVFLNSTDGGAEDAIEFAVISNITEVQEVIQTSLFDIIVEIPDKYKVIKRGEELLTSIKLINVGSAGRVDVFLDYLIDNPEGDVLIKKRETVAVETQANFVRSFDIPREALPGVYHITAQIVYADGKYAVSDHMFEIASEEGFDYRWIAGAMGVLVVVLFAFKSRRNLKVMSLRARVRKIIRKKMKNGSL